MLRKGWDKQKRAKKRQEKRKPRADCKLAQKNIEITILYDAWALVTHDACFNAVRISSILVQNHKIGLSIEFIAKTPKFENPFSDIQQFDKIDHYTW